MRNPVVAYCSILSLGGLMRSAIGGMMNRTFHARVTPDRAASPVVLRVPSSDVKVFEQIFVDGQYNFHLADVPRCIVDAGANIGLGSVYFASRLPRTRIIAIEPDPDNFRLLKMNTAPYPNVEPVLGALWNQNKLIQLIDPGVGSWGFTTRELAKDGKEGPEIAGVKTEGMTVDEVMTRFGVDRIDILKLDVEGAELGIFQDASAWIDRVDALIVELHDRIKPGCSRNFYEATRAFDSKWIQGENVFLARIQACLKRPQS